MIVSLELIPSFCSIDGLQWIRKQHYDNGRPTIATMSLGGPKSTAMDDAVRTVRIQYLSQSPWLTIPAAHPGRHTLHRGCCKWLFVSERIKYAEELIG
jgi:hypothetical protein